MNEMNGMFETNIQKKRRNVGGCGNLHQPASATEGEEDGRTVLVTVSLGNGQTGVLLCSAARILSRSSFIIILLHTCV